MHYVYWDYSWAEVDRGFCHIMLRLPALLAIILTVAWRLLWHFVM